MDDFIRIEENRLSVYLQEKGIGIQKEKYAEAAFDNPAVLSILPSADEKPPRLLALMPNGVSELLKEGSGLGFTTRTLITRPTLVPADPSSARQPRFLGLTLMSATSRPLVLLPTESALEIWEEDESAKEWHLKNSLSDAIAASITPARPGYTFNQYCFFAIDDLNGDGWEDLVVRKSLNRQGKMDYLIYEQSAEGGFPSESRIINQPGFDEYTWLNLHDFNGDGNADVLRSTWIREPWFIPGTYSGKVVVRLFYADEQGDLPEYAQQVFRKNDWSQQITLSDIDGDGYLDMALGYNRWNGREDIIRSVESDRTDFDLRIHFGGKSGFSEKHDFQERISAYSDQGNVLNSVFSWVYLSQLVNVSGDFNGDGKRDLLFPDGKRRISVRFFQSRQSGFSKKADLSFEADLPWGELITRDLNSDGVGDLMVLPRMWNDFDGSGRNGGSAKCRMFLSSGK